MKPAINIGLIIFVSLLLQTTLLATWKPKPDGVLAITLATAFARGPVAGAITGFFGGLAEDAMSGMSRGGFCLVSTLVGWLLGLLVKRFFSSNLIVLLAGAILGSFLHARAFQLLMSGLGVIASPLPPVLLVAWLLAQGLLSVLLLAFLRWRIFPEAYTV